MPMTTEAMMDPTLYTTIDLTAAMHRETRMLDDHPLTHDEDDYGTTPTERV